jgi:CubicO group peptidase (beta-lactamase class C family)
MMPTLSLPALAQPFSDKIEQIVMDFLGDTTPGLGVLVIQNGAVVHSAGYGLADIARNTPVTAQSLFDLASVSKQMTALAARMQIEDGLYDEGTPITQFLPILSDLGNPRPITVGDLIHHLSGLPDYLEWQDYTPQTSPAKVLEWLGEQELDHAPGRRFDYSNTG